MEPKIGQTIKYQTLIDKKATFEAIYKGGKHEVYDPQVSVPEDADSYIAKLNDFVFVFEGEDNYKVSSIPQEQRKVIPVDSIQPEKKKVSINKKVKVNSINAYTPLIKDNTAPIIAESYTLCKDGKYHLTQKGWEESVRVSKSGEEVKVYNVFKGAGGHLELQPAGRENIKNMIFVSSLGKDYTLRNASSTKLDNLDDAFKVNASSAEAQKIYTPLRNLVEETKSVAQTAPSIADQLNENKKLVNKYSEDTQQTKEQYIKLKKEYANLDMVKLKVEQEYKDLETDYETEKKTAKDLASKNALLKKNVATLEEKSKEFDKYIKGVKTYKASMEKFIEEKDAEIDELKITNDNNAADLTKIINELTTEKLALLRRI